jgi:hypothetical protein
MICEELSEGEVGFKTRKVGNQKFGPLKVNTE